MSQGQLRQLPLRAKICIAVTERDAFAYSIKHIMRKKQFATVLVLNIDKMLSYRRQTALQGAL